jgi:hypothetical protein
MDVDRDADFDAGPHRFFIERSAALRHVGDGFAEPIMARRCFP